MSRPLSTIEQLIDGCIVYALRLDGEIAEADLRRAIARVQAKHPALRATLRTQGMAVRYVDDGAGPIPLRVLGLRGDGDSRREIDQELETPFAEGQAQLRLVWLRGAGRSELLFAASHRICDGMSLLIVARETLRALYDDVPLPPYAPLTAADIVGHYVPAHPRRRRWVAGLIGLALRLLPPMAPPRNREHHLEWSAGAVLSSALRQRCKREDVSVHAALLVALDAALLTALGREQVPAWIESPMDGRRGRVPALADDRLFYGGGGLKFRTGQDDGSGFWDRVREAHRSIQAQIERETREIPSRYHFCELIRPPAPARLNALIRLGNALGLKGSWNRITLSNLGQLDLVDERAPFRLDDFRLYVHSHSVRALGLIVYALHGQLRFYCMGDEHCIDPERAHALREALMAVLEAQVARTQPAAASPSRVDGAAWAG
ncbi:condensation domain-containing protein [Lysobacter sp. cf310]|uniref:condensation domain-containing protein n=1 Tax=Lysobacter sp. cf310 TaxID=1761790 RepID=UPI0008E4FDC0|nr:condensation domain-containing protein [Lysobacter sp. cf310]SFK48663.1 Condensation domain-containing protein [Lysobacter sp. cf310]